MVVFKEWPSWWQWDLEFVPHLLKRMTDRSFDEVALREMLERSERYRLDVFAGRYVVQTCRAQREWEIIVEPDDKDELLVIITAYPKDLS